MRERSESVELGGEGVGVVDWMCVSSERRLCVEGSSLLIMSERGASDHTSRRRAQASRIDLLCCGAVASASRVSDWKEQNARAARDVQVLIFKGLESSATYGQYARPQTALKTEQLIWQAAPPAPPRTNTLAPARPLSSTPLTTQLPQPTTQHQLINTTTTSSQNIFSNGSHQADSP